MLFLPLACAQKASALLVAGSYTWNNYRHQADTAYVAQFLKEREFSNGDIFQFAYDDMATCEDNPFPGKLFHTLDHKNVYAQELITTRGEDVTSNNLYKFIQKYPGLEDEDVFFYYSDHGSPGQLGTPHQPYIFGDELRDALKEAKAAKRFNRMLFVIEACESGSLVNFINKVPNTIVITASGPAEQSYSFITDDDVDNVLTNLMTYHFFNTIEENSPSTSVRKIFEITKEKMLKEAKYSTPMINGDESLFDLPIATFVGIDRHRNDIKRRRVITRAPKTLVKQREAKKRMLEKIAASNGNSEKQFNARLELLKREKETERLAQTLQKIATSLNYREVYHSGDYDDGCYLPAVRYFYDKYGSVDEDDFGQIAIFGKFCKITSSNVIKAAIDKIL